MTKVNSWMTKLAKESGRNQLYPFAIGVIKSIVNDEGLPLDEAMEEIKGVLWALEQTWSDDTLPWDIKDIKEAPLPEGATEEIDLLNGSTTTWTLEEIMRREA